MKERSSNRTSKSPPLVSLLFLLIANNDVTRSFTISFTNHLRPFRSVRLSMIESGTVIGRALDENNKNDNFKGMGKKTKKVKKNGSSSSSFDVSKSLIKSEKLYEELLIESSKAFHAANDVEEETLSITSEYIVAARGKPGFTSLTAAADWVPVAQICIARPVQIEERVGQLDSAVVASVSYYCREINYVACLASPSTFQSLPRNLVEYSVEPRDSFIKYVYEDVIEGKPSSGNIIEGDTKVLMTKAKAREILGLEDGCNDLVLIKQAYKKKSFQVHPDRYINTERSLEEIDSSSNHFLTIKMAYESLMSGMRGSVNPNGCSHSWYESLGGKSRMDFFGPVDLMSVEKSTALYNKAFRSAVAAIDPGITMAFVARNQAALR